MYREDSGLEGFLGLVMLGASFFAGRKVGQNQAYKQIADQHRDQEIENLKKQIAYLQSERS